MEPFKNLMSDSDINEDCTAWYLAIKRLLDNHAPLKTRRVKSKRLSEWFNEEILESRKQRDRKLEVGQNTEDIATKLKTLCERPKCNILQTQFQILKIVKLYRNIYVLQQKPQIPLQIPYQMN